MASDDEADAYRNCEHKFEMIETKSIKLLKHTPIMRIRTLLNSFLFVLSTLLVVVLSACKPVIAQPKPQAIGTRVSFLEDKTTIVFQDGRGEYWFGGGPKGVYRFDGEQLVLYSKSDGLCSHSVLGIQEDRAGNVYFDTTEGVSKFNGEEFATLNVVKHDSADSGWKLKEDDLWFRAGWSKNGPYRYDGGTLDELLFPGNQRAKEFHRKFPNASWSPYGIYTLYRDRQGTMWFGTASLGVCRFDGKSHSWIYEDHLTQTPQGGEFGIRSIIEDKTGHYWFCNSRYRYVFQSGPQSSTGRQLKYRRMRGVGNSKTIEAERYPYFMSIVEDSKGHLWMATYDDGVWQYDGKQLIHHPIQLDQKNVLLFSVYKDNNGTLWLGSHNAGAFKCNGEEFEPYLSRN